MGANVDMDEIPYDRVAENTRRNKLKLLYPGQINHPKQAYYTNQEYLSGN